ncbi:hypothetical protein PR048_012460 [Dryococelus australis]|uniref:Uncharacterized protein n=1 Tax=Dryococelus australis TaxID=614101 RepID=A0ABQ9HQ97_9NEOP|nr:hypothetical protein PR048_012460 [Dryococelus australis]
MAEIQAALVRLQLAEGQVSYAVDLACNIAHVKECFKVDFVPTEVAMDTTDFDLDAHKACIKPGASGSYRVALPSIKIPMFYGNSREWVNYSNVIATLVSKNVDLTTVEKLVYLETSLVGKPLSMVHSLSISEANFAVSWQLLANCYQNKKLVASLHVDALLQAHLHHCDSF